MLNRRNFLHTGALALTGVGVGYPERAAQAQEGGRLPNFIYILCDDLGFGDLSCYGSPIIQTPHLDRLASEGVKLTDCYTAAPVCSPARAGIITGRNPYRCRIPDWIPNQSPTHLQRTEISVARLLKDRGYATALCGKWHLSGTLDGSQPTPGYHGFDHWFATQNNAAPSHRNPNNFIRNGEPVGELSGYSADLVAEEGIRMMRTLQDRPFALFLWFHEPHEPVASDDELMALYEEEPDESKREYYANVTQIDRAVGRLLHSIDELGLRDDTLVFFTSDNGPETLNRYRGAERSHGSPGPLRGMKLHLYEGGTRIPGIARWPHAMKAGSVSDIPVSGVDVLPTFCAMAGLSVPNDRALDGADFRPALLGEEIKREVPLYWRYDRALSDAKVALREGDWKLLANQNLQQFELYNLREDLQEENNLAQAAPEQLEALREKLYAIHFDTENDPISTWRPWRP